VLCAEFVKKHTCVSKEKAAMLLAQQQQPGQGFSASILLPADCY
jgi:hypothetical protein